MRMRALRPGWRDAVDVLAAEVRPGSVVVTLSAGDANRVGSELLALRRAGDIGRVAP